MNREQQIEEMTRLLEDMPLYDPIGLVADRVFQYGAQQIAEALYNAGYRKMDEVTLKLDLGDCTPEEIKQIAEMFNGEIKKQVAKEILQDWYDDVVHGMGVDGYYIKEYAKQYGVEVDE